MARNVDAREVGERSEIKNYRLQVQNGNICAILWPLTR